MGSRNLAIYTLSSYSIKKIKTYYKDIEHIHLRNGGFSPNYLISQIANFPSLRSFKVSMISDSMDGKFTPEYIRAFANNCPNLEAISLYIEIGHKNINEMKEALDIFFVARHQTLKSLDIHRSHATWKDMSLDGSCLTENLKLCQNLEDLLLERLELQNSTFEAILTLPKIRTLVLNKAYISFSQNVNLLHPISSTCN